MSNSINTKQSPSFYTSQTQTLLFQKTVEAKIQAKYFMTSAILRKYLDSSPDRLIFIRREIFDEFKSHDDIEPFPYKKKFYKLSIGANFYEILAFENMEGSEEIIPDQRPILLTD